MRVTSDRAKLIKFNIFFVLVLHDRFLKIDAQCDEFQWDCDNGQCIADSSKCDGRVDCLDGSDETAENCIQNYKHCPSYAFRCSYGACIEGTSKCNGSRDCADNSDELTSLCSNEEQDLQGRCSVDEMQCRSGECVSVDVMCDGFRDCADGTDESITVCGNFNCPEYSFHCGTGACISGKSQCNGSVECSDGSDEASELCGYPRKRHSLSPITRPPTRPTFIALPDRFSCRVPEQLRDIVVRLHPRNRTLTPGSVVGNYQTVHLECPQGFHVPHREYLCDNGRWSGRFPTACTRYCNGELLQGLSTVYHCSLDSQYVPPALCRRVLPGTVVEVRCAVGYQKNPHTPHIHTITCSADGRFDRQRETCELRCGKVVTNAIGLTANGINVLNVEVPWHVAIYLKADGARYKYICGGTIVSPSVIVSAAHCFWDRANRLVNDARFYQVVAGKFYKDYYSTADDNAQRREVQEIVVDHEFLDKENNFHRDIAVLKLAAPFVFSNNISAICLDEAQSADQYVPNDWRGTVVGWGESPGLGAVLQKVDMRTKSYHNCTDHLRYITSSSVPYVLPADKFCLENDHYSTICRGDSGGGFIVYNQYTDQYRILGVVSNAPFKTGDCARDGFVAVTNINYITDEVSTKLKRFREEDRQMF